MEVLISQEALKDIQLLKDNHEIEKIISRIKMLENTNSNDLYTKLKKITGYDNIYVMKSNHIRLFFTVSTDNTEQKLILIGVVRKTSSMLDLNILQKMINKSK